MPISISRSGCVASLLLALAGTVNADVFQTIALTAGTEDNVPRGLDSMHQLDSGFVGLELITGNSRQLGFNDTLTFSVALKARRYFQTGGFDNIGIGATLGYSHKFGFGAYAPRLGLALSLAREEFQGQARDNDLLTLEISYSKRLSPAWLFSAAVDYQQSSGDSPSNGPMIEGFDYSPEIRLSYDLYDYDAVSAVVDLEYSFENGLLLNGGYRRIDGATISSTTQPNLHLYKVAEAFYNDSAFDNNWFAYRLGADINEWSLGLSLPIGIDSSVDLGYSWHDIEGPGSDNYENSIFTITLIHNF